MLVVENSQLRSVPEIEFIQYAAEIVPHGALSKEQFPGDLSVAVALKMVIKGL